MHEDKEPETGCCSCVPEAAELSYGCAERKLVFTNREQEILARIREAALRARTIKEKLRVLSGDDGDRTHAELELQRLRTLRDELERERLAAAEERMHILGHV